MSLLSLIFGRGISRSDARLLSQLEKKLHYRFSKLHLLKRALTHRSYTNENRLSSLEQNERYEFLGDAVLELAVSHLMMEFFPESTEGELSKLRAAVVNERALAELARKLNLGKYLFLGRGEHQGQGREKDSLLSDAFEAVLGAVYLDSGFAPAFAVIRSQFTKLLHKATTEDINRDFKTKLQEEAQGMFRAMPRYHLMSETGPDHDKIFEVHLIIKEEVFGRGSGKSKKQAEQSAAREALRKIEGLKS